MGSWHSGSKATTLERKAYRDSVTPPIAEVVSSLRDHLGATLVAYIGRVNETRAVRQWAAGDRQPTKGVERRLRAAHQVSSIVLGRGSGQVAQAWMQGMNPDLHDSSPARVLRESDLDETGPQLLAAARHFVAS